jgi:L-rhamnose mutarotase
MQEIALHTRLTAGSVDTYQRVHAVIPVELDRALRAAGVASWKIWRDDLDLFHLVEVEDFDRMNELLAVDPADIEWQQRINALLEAASPGPGPLDSVWHLPEAPA